MEYDKTLDIYADYVITVRNGQALPEVTWYWTEISKTQDRKGQLHCWLASNETFGFMQLH